MMAASDNSGVDPLGRFSDRVEDYVKYRPGYPRALMDFLTSKAGLSASSAVADVGSGTGIFTSLLLGTGAKVYAVEPNAPMRHAAEAALASSKQFTSVDGTAEATRLPDRSVSFVTCAQAFHWFRPDETRKEFRRILTPKGWCALVWNSAVVDQSAFSRGYEVVKEALGTDFKQVRHESIAKEDRTDVFFGPGNWEKHTFGNFQELDLAGLCGRLSSSSYAPQKGHPGFEPMIRGLTELFERTQQNGMVRMEYVTELFMGHLG